jgi:peptidoglycan/xylan/chitin deacetylase (PgdA/CDA1 family)
MTGNLKLRGKRELLSRGLYWSGTLFAFSQLPARDSLLVLTYHRVGDPESDCFDPGVFSATGDEFYEQLAYLKHNLSPVTLEEALAFVEGTEKDKSSRCRVLITFDDGYLDNYETAYPILRSHGLQGVFFLCTGLVGSCFIPWWDRISYMVRTAQRRQFSLHYPGDLEVDVDRDGLTTSLQAILRLYKRPENCDSSRFIRELSEAAMGQEPSGTLRRFLSWDEAKEMMDGGMAIGAHTHSHTILSQLDPEKQFEELSQSREILKQKLCFEPESLAYPVGSPSSFTEETERIAEETGYRAAFSYYGGQNLPGKMTRFNIKRAFVSSQSLTQFRAQTTIHRLTGSFWP